MSERVSIDYITSLRERERERDTVDISFPRVSFFLSLSPRNHSKNLFSLSLSSFHFLSISPLLCQPHSTSRSYHPLFTLVLAYYETKIPPLEQFASFRNSSIPLIFETLFSKRKNGLILRRVIIATIGVNNCPF